MTNQASMRHLALIAILTLVSGSFLVTASEAAKKSTASGTAQATWMLPADAPSGGCGSDGDPDNPTVDQPQSRGNAIPGDVELVRRVSFVSGDGGGVALWWSRLLQLIGIR